ncbi:DUF5666 domain-containing protein, partial [Lichenihabitans sp. Uapishka_5]|uniref:DUF5666 domain-containing protein n=1 Tax=Lichenihabitans sp. Uapishka_5 TaxID=3037302 RepID=UPI0029E7FA33
MTRPRAWSRRRLLHATLGAAAIVGPASAQERPSGDRGMGGTGVLPPETEPGDRGIGGTGVIGTIRRFGSIVVNGLRITFPRSVRVRIDDRPARLQDLEIGHVVHVLARHHRGERLATRSIEAFSEVTGPIEAATPDGLTVLGQPVGWAPTRTGRRLTVGQWVAVSGLRRLDGTIVASLVARRPAGRAMVAGIPRLEADGAVWIGALPIAGLDPTLLGQRLRLDGRVSEGRLVVARARPAFAQILAGHPAELSIEDYVALADGAVQFGSGLTTPATALSVAVTGEERAIVSATVRQGQIQVSGIRGEASSARSAPGGRGPGGPHGPGGRPDG